MKLKTKLTALCAVVLCLVSLGLSGAMLWQVREQSYSALLERSEETLKELTDSFGQAVYHTNADLRESLPEKIFLIHCFRSAGVAGSALIVNGENLSASTPFAPQDYLTVEYIPKSTRCSYQGKEYLVLGKLLDVRENQCEVYFVADAAYIHSQLLQLAGRFALLALVIGMLGLLAVRWLLGRGLRPLARLSEAADQIAAGGYSQRVPVQAKDEIGQLAGNFNRMASAVETHICTLQEQNERQKLFTGAVTHELKTPLTSLLLNVNTLRTVYLTEEKREALLESMDVQLHWLETMVRKLLTLLSMKKNARFSLVPVPDLLDQVQLLTKEICQKYGVSLEISCDTAALSMDKDLICSALVNLIENSAKASKPGQRILITAECSGFTVTDHGCGISEKDLKRVTDPFYMGDPSRSKEKGGFGLGLALVQEIAQVHGGTLELESAPGQGTTARLILGNQKEALQ